MPSKLTVLFLSHTSNLYGAERSLLDLLIGLKHSDINVRVLLPSPGPMTEKLDREGIEYEVCFFVGWLGRKQRFLKGALRAVVNLVAFIRFWLRFRNETIDLIYTNTVYSPVGALLSLSLGTPHIWHVREFVHEDMQANYDFGTRPSMAFISNSASRIICNSRKIYEKMAKHINENKLLVIYNGLLDADSRPQRRSRDGLNATDRLRLCIVGRVAPSKGQSDAIRVLQVLIDQGIDAELRIVGSAESAYKQQLESLAVQFGISEHIIWEGYASNVIELFDASDIALVCSKSEAFGRVAVEAMSVGCPVVGTNSGGLTEVIEHGSNGLLYPPGNITRFAKEILKLRNQPNLYQMISSNAINSVYNRFTKARYVANIKATIFDCVPKDSLEQKGTFPRDNESLS